MADVETIGRPMKVVGVGGSVRERSTTELVVRAVLEAVERRGAETVLFDGPSLVLPPYEPGKLDTAGARLVKEMGSADALVLGSPGYHGIISGLVKNALDYVEELKERPRVYIDGVPVACVATAYGWQAAVNTLGTLRMLVHALRGWPTPLGIAVNMAEGKVLGQNGEILEPKVAGSIEVMADQLMSFRLGDQRLPLNE